MGINAAMLGGNTSFADESLAFKGAYDVLYMTPEKVITSSAGLMNISKVKKIVW